MHATRIVMLLCCLLVACGGGGDGGVTPPVIPPPTPVAPTVALSTSTLTVNGFGATTTVSATVSPASATISWSSSNPAVASVSGAGASATVTAVSAGTTQILATAASGTLTASAAATVTVTPVVKQVVFAASTASMVAGTQAQLTPTVTADAGASVRLLWTSENVAIATVDSTGRVSAVSAGTATIRATSDASPTLSATVTITVTAAPRVNSVVVTPATDSALIGQTKQFAAVVSTDGSLVRTVIWRSSAPAIATVDATGKTTAIAAGSASIIAIATADTTIRSTATLTVRAPVVRAVSFTLATTLSVGRSVAAVPTVTADSGADTRATWTSSAPNIASVDGVGIVTALAPGSATITLRSVAFPAIAASASITLTLPPFTNLWSTASLGVGGAVYSGLINGVVANSPTVGLFVTAGRAPNIPEGPSGVSFGSPTFISRNTEFNPYWSRYTGEAAGSSASDIFITAFGQPANSGYTANTSVVLRWNGSTLENTNWPAPTGVGNPSARAITSIGVQQAMAASSDGSVWRRMNGAWSQVAPPSTATSAQSIAAWTPDSAVIGRCRSFAGESRVAVMKQGAISLLPNTTLGDPTAGYYSCAPFVAAMPGGDVVATLGSAVARWNGTTWTPYAVTLESGEEFYSGVICGGVITLGTSTGRVLQMSGSQFVEVAASGDAAISAVRALSCGGDGAVRAGSDLGLVARRSGNGWVDEHFTPTVNSVHLQSPDVGIAVGSRGLVYKWNGTTWTRVRRRSESESLIGGWSSPDGQLFAVGQYAPPPALTDAGVLLRFDGTQWIRELVQQVGTGITGRSIWGSSSTNVFATMSNGRIMRFDGASWTTSINSGANLWAMHGSSATSIMTVGIGGIALRFDGSAWTPMPSIPAPGTLIVNKLFVASSTVAFAGASSCSLGDTGGLWRWNGSAWVDAGLASSGFSQCVRTVFGTSASDVFVVVGTEAVPYKLLHWNGAAWSVITGVDVTDATAGSGVPGLSAIVGKSKVWMGLSAAGFRAIPVTRRNQ